MLDQHITKDAPSYLVRDLGTNKLYAERVAPYGLLYLRLETGELPVKYQGAYTTLSAVEQAMEQYQVERIKALPPVSPVGRQKKVSTG